MIVVKPLTLMGPVHFLPIGSCAISNVIFLCAMNQNNVFGDKWLKSRYSPEKYQVGTMLQGFPAPPGSQPQIVKLRLEHRL